MMPSSLCVANYIKLFTISGHMDAVNMWGNGLINNRENAMVQLSTTYRCAQESLRSNRCVTLQVYLSCRHIRNCDVMWYQDFATGP